MDLPMSSFVCHLSLLTVKNVNLVKAHDGMAENEALQILTKVHGTI